MKEKNYNLEKEKFLQSEHNSRHGIFIDLTYVDMLDGDIISAYLLSQIVFWHLHDKDGNEKLKIESPKGSGIYWIVKTKKEWYEETRLKRSQYERARNVLIKNKLIIHKVSKSPLVKHNYSPVEHIRLNWKTFLDERDKVLMEKAKEYIKNQEIKALSRNKDRKEILNICYRKIKDFNVNLEEGIFYLIDEYGINKVNIVIKSLEDRDSFTLADIIYQLKAI